MALLGNLNVYNKNPITQIGFTDCEQSATWRAAGTRSRFYSQNYVAGEMEKSSVPNGYTPPYSWILAPKAGGIGSNTGIETDSDITGNLAAGKNIEATIACTGDLTAICSLVVSLIAALTGSGTITNAALVGKLEMIADIAASGDITGTLRALAHMSATFGGSASLSPEVNATANMEADITPFTELSPENLAAAVWNAAATAYNDSGTMGRKQNDALSLAKFIGLK